jgi:hypothetical protein
VAGWDGAAQRAFAEACAWRARDLALPHLERPLREALAGAAGLAGLVAAVDAAVEAGRLARPAPPHPALLAGDAARTALRSNPGTTSYIAAAQAGSLGGGRPAFEAERAWQARWLAERLGLEGSAG